MDNNTALHVLWGVYNNPLTPDAKKREVLEAIKANIGDDKLSQKIESVINA